MQHSDLSVEMQNDNSKKYLDSSPEEIAQREAEMQLSIEFLKLEESQHSVRTCDCTRIIWKDGGCNWTKCICGQEFCWACWKVKGGNYVPAISNANMSSDVQSSQLCPYGSPGCNSH